MVVDTGEFGFPVEHPRAMCWYLRRGRDRFIGEYTKNHHCNSFAQFLDFDGLEQEKYTNRNMYVTATSPISSIALLGIIPRQSDIFSSLEAVSLEFAVPRRRTPKAELTSRE